MVHPLPVTAPRRDTAAWRLQVWLSIGIAASLCAIGLAWLPGNDIDRAFMVMGYVYCVSSAFALSKFVRDNERARVDTPLWKAVVWGAFFAAMALTGWGLVRMWRQAGERRPPTVKPGGLLVAWTTSPVAIPDALAQLFSPGSVLRVPGSQRRVIAVFQKR